MAKDTSANNYPIEECVREAEKILAKNPDKVSIYQKFTCENCKQRLTMPDANVFHNSGTCDQCGHVTLIRKCNYMIVAKELSGTDIVKLLTP